MYFLRICKLEAWRQIGSKYQHMNYIDVTVCLNVLHKSAGTHSVTVSSHT